MDPCTLINCCVTCSSLLEYSNYLQLLYREVKEILLFEGYSRPICPTKYSDRSEECNVDKIGRGNPWLSNTNLIFKFPKK